VSKTTYLRLTNWSHPNMPPLTVAVEAADLKSGDPYEAIESYLDAGFFVTYEVFEEESGTDGFVAAVAHAAASAVEHQKREHDMAIGYFWYANALRLVADNGVLASTRPAPVSREDMAWVLRNLAKCEHYKGQYAVLLRCGSTTIEMRDGEVLPV
jgi:hypothetical protein